MTPLALGQHARIPMAEYIEDPGISCSTVLEMRRSPAAAEYRRTHPSPPTSAKQVGSAFHCLATEADEYRARYVIAGTCAATLRSGKPCTNSGSVMYDEDWFCGVRGHAPDGAAPPLQTILSPDQAQHVADMVFGLAQHPLWEELVAAADVEVTLLYERDGIRCKARPDLLVPPYCVDLKSTRDIGGFPREAIRYGYDVRGAWYLDACKALGLKIYEYVIAAVANTAPHEAYLWRVDDWWIEQGRVKLAKLWSEFRSCHESGRWPGTNEWVETMPLPEWVGSSIDFSGIEHEEDE